MPGSLRTLWASEQSHWLSQYYRNSGLHIDEKLLDRVVQVSIKCLLSPRAKLLKPKKCVACIIGLRIVDNCEAVCRTCLITWLTAVKLTSNLDMPDSNASFCSSNGCERRANSEQREDSGTEQQVEHSRGSRIAQLNELDYVRLHSFSYPIRVPV